MTDAGQPIVIDNGTGVLKAGFAGGERPSCVFPSCVGRTKHPRTMISSNSKLSAAGVSSVSGKGKSAKGKAGGAFVGAAAMEHRGVMRLRYPMGHGSESDDFLEDESSSTVQRNSRRGRLHPAVVEDWDDMERIWAHVYSRDCLNSSSSEHPVLLTEAPLNPTANRERMARCFFESFNSPSLFVSRQATLSLCGSIWPLPLFSCSFTAPSPP